MTPNMRLREKIRFSRTARRVEKTSKDMAERAQRDKTVAQAISSIPMQALAQWKKESSTNRAALDWAYEVFDNARSGNESALQGCEAALAVHFSSYQPTEASHIGGRALRSGMPWRGCEAPTLDYRAR